METDPITKIYDALFQMVADHEAATSQLFRLGNEIKFRSESDPTKQNINTVDVPELVLSLSKFAPMMDNTSSSSEVTLGYTWLISSGSYDSISIGNIVWEMFRLMHDWKTALTALTYSGQQFVKSAKLLPASFGLSDPDRNRGIEGWSSVWEFEIYCVFNRSII